MSRDDRASNKLSAFAAAAAALESELKRFEDIAASLARSPLNSEKAIEHAARLTRDAADAQARFAEQLHGLVALVGTANERQRAAAATINGRVSDIDARIPTTNPRSVARAPQREPDHDREGGDATTPLPATAPHLPPNHGSSNPGSTPVVGPSGVPRASTTRPGERNTVMSSKPSRSVSPADPNEKPRSSGP